MSRRDLLMDVRPLRSSRQFRELWIGSSFGSLGVQLSNVAVLFQVWELTRSPLWTGAIGLAIALPMLVFGLIGGALADAMDRRVLVCLAITGQLLAALALAVQAFAENGSVVLLLALVSVSSGSNALGSAARRTFPVRLLPGDEVAAGIALQSFAFQAAMLLGPAFAGLMIARWGLTSAYAVQALAVLVSLLAVVRLPPMPQTRNETSTGDSDSGSTGGSTGGSDGGSAGSGGRRLRRPARGGWRIIGRRPPLWGSLVTDLAATLLAMPISLFPLVNEVRFGGDPQTLGFFLSAVAVGGISAGLLSGSFTRVRRAGRLQLTAAAVWGLALAGFGLADSLWLALGCLTVAGAADTISVVTRAALVQLETPDEFRGRVSSVEHVIGVAGPELGNFRGGVVASLTSASFALTSGGLVAAALVGLVAATNRPLRHYRPPSTSVVEGGQGTPAQQDPNARP